MPKKRLEADIIIVGSGIGGSTIARELAKRDKNVLIVEKGRSFSLNQIGSEIKALKFYDKQGIWSRSKEGVIYYRAIMAGGTSIISCGNGVRSLEKEFKDLGIDLKKEFLETEKELGINPVPNSHIGKGTKKIMGVANKVGFKMVPMPKCINFKKCISCGNCVLGCCRDAKWTALEYIKEARDKGASLITGIDVIKVLVSNGKAVGIEGYNQKKEKIKIRGNIVILAAGGIGTPIILQNSGLEAGQKLFLDLFNVTFGLTKNAGMNRELMMAAVHHNRGFILSPFIDVPLAATSIIPLSLPTYLKIALNRDRLLGIMVKIKDEHAGKVNKDGSIEKTPTPNDLEKLNKGVDIARKILVKSGVDSKTIITTRIRGAHPGGTAAIGEVVNKNLETRIKGLYVCDASVLPEAPGLPPIVTIIALAKRFAKSLYSG